MRLLDLFCAAGGSAMGYYEAGFTEIVGVDIHRQPNYPFTFVQADALRPPFRLEDFDLIHASPPCQAYSSAMRHLAAPQPKLIGDVRDMLDGSPHVIENVPGAPLATASDLFGRHGVVLCGKAFGLRIIRHRLFETSFPVIPPTHPPHLGEIWNPHRAESRERFYAKYGRQDAEIPWAKEMGVGWMGRYEAREAIPPAFTKFIGEAFLAQAKVETT
jgi:DNA (cytosine-5)-methyltransferase 1